MEESEEVLWLRQQIRILGEALEWYTYDEDGGNIASTALLTAEKQGYTIIDAYVKERLLIAVEHGHIKRSIEEK